MEGRGSGKMEQTTIGPEAHAEHCNRNRESVSYICALAYSRASVNTARINAGNISTTSARAAKDIQELKTNLKELLLDMKRMRSLYVEHNVVSSNYRSAIKRPVGETASLSSGPSHKIPDSPDMGVSAIVSTEASTVFYSISTAASLKEALINDENSAFITAPSLQSSSTSCSASVGNSVHAYAVAAERNQKSPASSVSQNYGAVVNQSALADRDLDGISHLPGYEQLHLGTRSLGSYSGEEVSTQQRYAGYLKSLFQTKFRKRSITESSFPQKQARAINVTYLPSYGWMINVQDIMLWIDLGRITE